MVSPEPSLSPITKQASGACEAKLEHPGLGWGG